MRLRRTLLAAGALAFLAPSGPLMPSLPPIRDAESAAPEHWSFRKVAPGVLSIGVPVFAGSWSELGRAPESLELLIFDVALPGDLALDQLDTLIPVVKATVDMADRGPGIVPFEVSGLVGGSEYSAALIAHFAEEGDDEVDPDPGEPEAV